MRLHTMLGYKLFKEDEDHNIHMIRIYKVKVPFNSKSEADPAECTIYNYDTQQKEIIRTEELKNYTPIIPDGYLTVNIATIKDNEGKPWNDIIVTGSKILDMQLGMTRPYCVCRQNITDIFANLFCQKLEPDIVGLSVNLDTCPSNFDFGIMLAVNEIRSSTCINFYRLDTLEDLYPMINLKKFDKVLEELYKIHVKKLMVPGIGMKEDHKGWCKNLKRLLEINNFQSDLDQMLGITALDFTLSNYLVEEKLPGKDTTYQRISDDLGLWLSNLHREDVRGMSVIEFDHDINLADFNNSYYKLYRDNTKKVYLGVYTGGKVFSKDLESLAEEMDFSTKFKLKLYKKYNRNNKK